jgi:ElaB/YqjD/DUF883 family membrane-anchored ribosome-binding protein
MPTKPSTAETGANGQTLEVGPSALSREARDFLADIEDLVKATTSLTGEDLARAKARLAERITAAKASIEKMGGAVADGTRHAARTADSYVHEHPWQAIGIGAAAGVLLGVLIARRT